MVHKRYYTWAYFTKSSSGGVGGEPRSSDPLTLVLVSKHTLVTKWSTLTLVLFSNCQQADNALRNYAVSHISEAGTNSKEMTSIPNGIYFLLGIISLDPTHMSEIKI